MASKNKNPYREGSKYAKVFDALRSAGQKGITRKELIAGGNSIHDVTVVLSPRAEGFSTRNGDCRGNYSAQGEGYYVEKRKKEGEEARFVLRWRKVSLDKRVRPLKKEVVSKKTAKKVKAKKVKAPAQAVVAETVATETTETVA